MTRFHRTKRQVKMPDPAGFHYVPGATGISTGTGFCQQNIHRRHSHGLPVAEKMMGTLNN
jgi:hypothetical protein